jgi:hypothetical protein
VKLVVVQYVREALGLAEDVELERAAAGRAETAALC